MAERTIRGQAWIQDGSLVQEIITFSTTGKETSSIEMIVPDIWSDLTSSAGLYKFNDAKNYFYWEYKMTDLEDNDITVNFECPRPDPDLFQPPYDPSTGNGEYAKFWLGKLKTAAENEEKSSVVQRKEVTFPGSSYVKQDGTTITLPDYVFRNNDLGDITNLINLF